MGWLGKFLLAALAASILASSPFALGFPEPKLDTRPRISSTRPTTTPGRSAQGESPAFLASGDESLDAEHNPRQALAVGAAPSAPTIATSLALAVDGEPFAVGHGCTTTITPVKRYPCSTDGIETVYPGTKTLFSPIDCGRCTAVFVEREVYFCPLNPVLEIKTVNHPSTSWSTVCAGRNTRIGMRDGPTLSPARASATSTMLPGSDRGGRADDHGGLRARQACQTTRVVQPQKTAGPVATEYQRTVVETIGLNCHGCELRLSTAVGGYGPVVRFTTTTTAPIATSTVYVCQ